MKFLPDAFLCCFDALRAVNNFDRFCKEDHDVVIEGKCGVSSTHVTHELRSPHEA